MQAAPQLRAGRVTALPDPGPTIAPPMAGPWSDGAVSAARRELSRYLDEVADGSLDELATGCVPWTGRDVTIHLAETFDRFSRMLAQGRHGDFTPPFGPDVLDDNPRLVAL